MKDVYIDLEAGRIPSIKKNSAEDENIQLSMHFTQNEIKMLYPCSWPMLLCQRWIIWLTAADLCFLY
jgi:hypothetical protein